MQTYIYSILFLNYSKFYILINLYQDKTIYPKKSLNFTQLAQ